jgi:hypothetical protein
MIDPLNKLTVLHDDNGVFSNHSDNAADFIRDNFDMALDAAQDYLYIGFSKPFNSVYVAITTANLNANTLAAQYYNGASWVSLSLTDETKGFTRSGYLFFDKSQLKNTTINGINSYYIRLRPSVTHSLTTFRGINLIFADDHALKQEFFEVDHESLLPSGESTHLVQCVGARNSIVQMLRNKGYTKTNAESGASSQLTYWDLHDIFEIKQAAVLLTLSKIFFMLSDSREDTWWAKYTEYQDKFEEAFQLVTLALDSNDDGVADEQEKIEEFRVQRWLR